ncbi:MAG: CBS domain-containing protein [Thermodesulfovibrionia bacterium]|nr:CBS domain-containing protein [Thermodesulfovibrionia bacterium]
MSLFGELFISELLNKPVLDPKGDELGRVSDFVVIKGEHLPKVSALILNKKDKLRLEWDDLSLFNKRVISSKIYASHIKPYESSEDDLLIVRDIFDKQIVDADGAKVVRVNDVKLEGKHYMAWLAAIDVGMSGILRRLGIEGRSESVYRLFGKTLSQNLIGWGYLQPLEPRLTKISLTVPRQMLSELHPADIADIINSISQKDGASFFNNLDIETAAEALAELQPEMQADIMNSMDTEKAADIIEEMPPDEAADVLSDLPKERADEILEHVEKEEAEDIQELLRHEEDTAGGLMTNDFISYPPDITIREATERFKTEAQEAENVYYLYIVDKEEKLQGVASLREVLIADNDSYLADIMETNLKTVVPGEDEMVVAEIISKYNLLALPVVDESGYMHGIITVDDIVDILLPPASKKKRRRV